VIAVEPPPLLLPAGIKFNPVKTSLRDDAVAGTVVATFSVSTSDGSPFSGTLGARPADTVAVAGTTRLVLARRLNSADDGVQRWGVTATQNGVSASGFIQVQVTANAPPAPSPEPSDPGPGSIFVVTPGGFELAPRRPEETERNDADQKALHIRLTRRVERLREAMTRISNTHPTLAAECTDYAVFVGPDLADLDVASLWSAGSGLFEFVRAFETQNLGSTITPPIEPETLAEFRALLRDHTAFILGFDTGRKLTARTAALHAAERRPEEIKDTTLAVLRPMLKTRRLLAVKARHLVLSLTRVFEDLDAKTFAVLVAGVETGKNGLIAFGRALHPVVLSFAAADLALTLAGEPNAETLRATALYLHDNRDALIAFVASDPQLSEWLLWLIERARGLVGDSNRIR
jgi:hypothetical protein